MGKKFKKLFRISLLALLPALILRPVVVCVHNGATQPINHEISTFTLHSLELSTPHTALRHIAREAPDSMVLVHCITKAKAPSLSESRLSLEAVSCNTSPRNFLVLRI